MYRLFPSVSVPPSGAPPSGMSPSGTSPSGAVAASVAPVGLNVFMMPADLAYPFLAFCYANYASGSVVDFSDPGSPLLLRDTAAPVDVRTAGKAYDVMKGADRLDQPDDLMAVWQDDTVAVAVGCSVAVDRVLQAADITPKHIALGCQLPVYRTGAKTRAVGPFSPPLHVSMRIVKKTDADRAIAVTNEYPALHGAPIHAGDPAGVAIPDLTAPVLGKGLTPDDDEVCLFWGCGVTLRAAISGVADARWMANSEGSLVPSSLPPAAFRVPLQEKGLQP